LQQFTGNYRINISEWHTNLSIRDNHLFVKPITQIGLFLYPLSDTSFLIEIDPLGFVIQSFSVNEEGKVFKYVVDQSWDTTPFFLWKQDSLIIHSEELLEEKRYREALNEFREAYSRNPEHYYLGNYIRHLEFIQSPEYEKISPVLNAYPGEYGDLVLYTENNQTYYRDEEGLIFKLLPLSEHQFMIPSQYNRQIQIVKDNDSIRGMKFLFRDGKEEFYARTD